MSGLVAACWAQAPGLAIGALLGWWAATRRLRREDEETTEVLSDADRAAIEVEFATHRAAVTEQVSAFANILAGDDPVLRARLRKIEDGRQRA